MTDANGVASLSGTNVATLPAGTYPGAVTVVFGGDSSDAASTGSGDLSIAQATPTVTWAMPADITQGQALGAVQLDATASVPGTFAYSPPAGTVLPAGTGQTLTAMFTPTDATDYHEREQKHDAECPEPNGATGRDGGESNFRPDHGRHARDDHRH